ncbi:hypothetical protein TL16_g01096 [Triparma laevis f. inornata]|uniref:Fungal lipase-type domain-containing protein n=1 Tax=Triparma laevis f. inornata TaxID=1714386 RepID=A0A9W7DRP6_9STRA|nr:hypothetical protein TL16_g01096 [Triparma laevis f. inornata]
MSKSLQGLRKDPIGGALIKLESLGSTGGRVICAIQFIVFTAALMLIGLGTYASDRTIPLRTSSPTCDYYNPVIEFNPSQNEPLVSSCSSTTLHNPNADADSIENSLTTITSTLTNLGTVLGKIGLSITFPNGTAYGIDNYTKFTVDGEDIILNYNLELVGCRFKPDSKCGAGDWLDVLSVPDSPDSLAYVMEKNFLTSKSFVAGAEIFSIFQNQENIINDGWVNSYKLRLQIHNNTELVGQETSQAVLQFHYIDVQSVSFEKLGRTILFFLNLFVLMFWIIKNYNSVSFVDWLPEKKWLTYMVIATVIFQNPVLLFAQYEESPSIALAVATKCNMVVAYSLLGWVFLCFADGVSRSLKTAKEFYLSKTVLLSLYLVLSLAFELIATPVFGGLTSDRSPLLSTYNWSQVTKVADLSIGLSLIMLNAVIMVVFWRCVLNSYRLLSSLPYIEYRYVHLSYRFYFVHSLSLIFYSFASYSMIVWGLVIDLNGAKNFEDIHFEEEFNSLLRTTKSSFGQQLFVAVYVHIFAYLHLPPDNNKKSMFQQMLLTQFEKYEEPSSQKLSSLSTFCLETAAWLLEVSWQSYYDSPGKTTTGGWGDINVEQHSLKQIAQVHQEENACHAIVLRDLRRNRIIIAFRGTSCGMHWNTNLKYSIKKFDVESLPLPNSVTSEIERYISENVDASDYNNPKIFRSTVDTETSLGFDELKDSLLRSSEYEPKKQTERIQNIVQDVETLGKRVVENVEKMVTENLGFTGIHGGFAEAYESIRPDLMQHVAKELLENPADVYVTGHSLGGALAHICAYDLASNVLPKLNKTLETKWRAEIKALGSEWIDLYVGRLKRAMRLCCYSFGAPRSFSRATARRYNEKVPATFRVACDGDIVTSFPKYAGGKYKHVKNHVVVDGQGSGQLIVSPSFVERRFHLASRNKLKRHSMQCYRLGIWGSIGQTAEERARAFSQSGLNQKEIDAFIEKGRNEVEAEAEAEAEEDDNDDAFIDAVHTLV